LVFGLGFYPRHKHRYSNSIIPKSRHVLTNCTNITSRKPKTNKRRSLVTTTLL